MTSSFVLFVKQITRWTAADRTIHRVVAAPITTTVVQGTRRDTSASVPAQCVLVMATAHRPVAVVRASMVATAVAKSTCWNAVFAVRQQPVAAATDALDAERRAVTVMCTAELFPTPVAATDAIFSIGGHEVASSAAAFVTADRIDAFMFTAAVIHRTLIHIDAVVSVGVELKAVETAALVAAV
jgi:hypothetical protein